MIYTIAGFMGSGKSTLGRLLSARVEGSTFIDLDDWLEKMTGRRIPDIFREEQAERVLLDLWKGGAVHGAE